MGYWNALNGLTEEGVLFMAHDYKLIEPSMKGLSIMDMHNLRTKLKHESFRDFDLHFINAFGKAFLPALTDILAGVEYENRYSLNWGVSFYKEGVISRVHLNLDQIEPSWRDNPFFLGFANEFRISWYEALSKGQAAADKIELQIGHYHEGYNLKHKAFMEAYKRPPIGMATAYIKRCEPLKLAR
jgi:hypothetical protein